MMKAGIYARVSTHDQQTLPMQVQAMRRYVKQRGWKLHLQVEEVGSGGKQRPQRDELLKAARRREVDAIVVWKLDRWGRSLPDLDIYGSVSSAWLGNVSRPPQARRVAP